MLDFIYYPVSAILLVWHKFFGLFLDPASGYSWALSVVFLVFTLRAILFKPFVHQVRSMKKMQEFAPQVRDLQAKYGNDRQRLAQEMQKLQSEQGFNPMSGCLPVLVQVPVFIGLFHVLRGFVPGAQSNFLFNADDVNSFVKADLFGAKLSNTISQGPEQLALFQTNQTAMFAVGVPLMIAAAIATHFTARHSVARQTSDAASNPQAAMMNRLTLWVFPMFAIIGGPFLPLAILLYWLANNFWTLGQQYVVYRKIDREEAQRDGGAQVVDSTAVETTTDSPSGTSAASTVDAPSVIDSTAQSSTVEPTVVEESEPGKSSASGKSSRPSETPGLIEENGRATDQPDEVR